MSSPAPVYLMIVVICANRQSVLSAWWADQENCDQIDLVNLPQIPLEFLKEEYHRKFGYPPKIRAVNTNYSVTTSAASIRMSDRFDTGVFCGIPADNDTAMETNDVRDRNISNRIYPWVTYIRTSSHVCGGVLISDAWVLTSALCADRAIKVILGSANIKTSWPGMEQRNSKKEFIYPGYKINVHGKDVGLIKLSAAVRFNDYIRPICIPAFGADFKPFKCFLVNWGRYDAARGELSDDLHVMAVSVLEEYECHYRWILNGQKMTENDICLRFQEGLSEDEKCTGDSGGPLICDVHGVYFVAGVSGFVESSCTNGFLPDRLMRISNFEHWITETVMAN